MHKLPFKRFRVSGNQQVDGIDLSVILITFQSTNFSKLLICYYQYHVVYQTSIKAFVAIF